MMLGNNENTRIVDFLGEAVRNINEQDSSIDPKKENNESNLRIVEQSSLGSYRGQGIKAVRAIRDCIAQGSWLRSVMDQVDRSERQNRREALLAILPVMKEADGYRALELVKSAIERESWFRVLLDKKEQSVEKNDEIALNTLMELIASQTARPGLRLLKLSLKPNSWLRKAYDKYGYCNEKNCKAVLELLLPIIKKNSAIKNLVHLVNGNNILLGLKRSEVEQAVARTARYA